MRIPVMYLPTGENGLFTGGADSTVADAVRTLGISDLYSIVLDGDTQIDPNDYATTSLAGISEIWAVKGSKGA